MPRILRSDARRARVLPWEMIGHIVSFCDTKTLATLSLVSFGTWELAGPLLYEHVEIRSLDALKALFFLEATSNSHRLQPSVPLVARIRSLDLAVNRWRQKAKPLFRQPVWVGEDDDDSEEEDSAVVPHWEVQPAAPHRLLHACPDGCSGFLFEYFCVQLFPHLNPRTVIHNEPVGKDAREGWTTLFMSPDTSFLASWQDLEQVIFNSCSSIFVDGPDLFEAPLYSLWTPRPMDTSDDGGRTLELVIRITSRRNKFVESVQHSIVNGRLGFYLGRLGVMEDLAARVSLKARLVVSPDAAGVVQREVERLVDWMKEILVVQSD